MRQAVRYAYNKWTTGFYDWASPVVSFRRSYMTRGGMRTQPPQIALIAAPHWVVDVLLLTESVWQCAGAIPPAGHSEVA